MSEMPQRFTRRNFVGGAAVAAAAMAAAVAGCSTSSEASEESTVTSTAESATEAPTDGTSQYDAGYGSAMGKWGDIELNVLFDGDELVYVDVLRNHETPGVGSSAVAQIIQVAIDSQTLNIDDVSGATISSSGIKGALAAGIDAAGQSASQWRKRDAGQYTREETYPTECDVVVIGGGGAGLSSAIKAKRNGLDVVLVEKMGVIGGSTAFALGALAAPNNWIQEQEGIEDSPELLKADMLAGGDNMGDPDLVDVIANNSTEASHWLTFEGSVAWEPELYYFGGHSVKRSLMPKGSLGAEYTTKLTARCEKIKLPYFTRSQASELVKDGDAVTGVTLIDQIDGSEHTIMCSKVIMACGGFARNIEMRSSYVPSLDESVLCTAAMGATGDGIVMGEAAGAELLDMDLIQTYPIGDIQTGSLLEMGNFRYLERSIMINVQGDRFVEELDRRDVLSDAIRAQDDGQAYMLWDQEGVDNTDVFETYADERDTLFERKMMFKGDTLEEVAANFGIDAAELQKTVDNWNEYCDKGEDPEWNYRGTMNKIETAPFYLLVYSPSVHYTMGGLRINPQAEVLNKDGEHIKGLYAAGEVAGHIMGNNRLGSTSIADIFSFGLVAGDSVSQDM